MNWSQIQTVLWLRWRLTRNQWARSGGVGAALSAIAAVAGVFAALCAGAAGIFGGAMGLSHAPLNVAFLVWDMITGVFLFPWFFGVMAEVQRSETIDLGRLLHLPVSLRWVFLVNYLASHLTISLVVFLPGVFGVCLGLLWMKGLSIILLVPLVLGFVFMITAWTYCLRGWLVSLMVNPRRRRNVIMGVTATMILIAQLPNLYFNVYLRRWGRGPANHGPAAPGAPSSPLRPGRGGDEGRRPFEMPPAWLAAHTYVPLLWLSKGAAELPAGNAVPAVCGALGTLLLGAAGLARAFRSTMRFYEGREKSSAAKPKPSSRADGTVRQTLLDRRLPFMPEEVAALALASFRSMSRAPEVKMALVSNVVVVFILGGMMVSQHSLTLAAPAQLFVATGACALPFFGLLQIMFNHFGFDRDGFRALMLLPAGRADVLFAKNLSVAPVALGLGLIFSLAVKFIAHLPWLVLVSSLLQVVATFLLLSLLGNVLSILVPYRIAMGSLKPTKPSPKTVLMIIVSQMLFPVALIPVFIPALLAFGAAKWAGWPPAPVDALFSAVLLAASALLYRASLGGLGRLLERREKAVLLAVSQEVE